MKVIFVERSITSVSYSFFDSIKEFCCICNIKKPEYPWYNKTYPPFVDIVITFQDGSKSVKKNSGKTRVYCHPDCIVKDKYGEDRAIGIEMVVQGTG